MSKLFSMDPSQISGGQLAIIAISMIVAILAFILILRYCLRLEKETGVSSLSLLKIIMIAVPPLIHILLELVKVNAPDIIFTIATIVMCVAVAIWNIYSFGIVGGVLFSIIHICAGLILSLSIAALIFGAFVLAVIYFFYKAMPDAKADDYVQNVNTRECFMVTEKGSDYLMIEKIGRLRKLDTISGTLERFMDDYGNEYVWR